MRPGIAPASAVRDPLTVITFCRISRLAGLNSIHAHAHADGDAAAGQRERWVPRISMDRFRIAPCNRPRRQDTVVRCRRLPLRYLRRCSFHIQDIVSWLNPFSVINDVFALPDAGLTVTLQPVDMGEPRFVDSKSRSCKIDRGHQACRSGADNMNRMFFQEDLRIGFSCWAFRAPRTDLLLPRLA